MSQTKKYGKILLKIFSILILLFIPACNQVFHQPSPEELKMLQDTCNNLTPPDYFVKVREYPVLISVGATIQKNYESNVDPEMVKQYYKNKLVSQGWEYELFSEGGTNELKFYKGKFEISVEYEYLSLTSNRLYMVSCSWEMDRKE